MNVPYLGVWCPTCREDCVPMRDNTCGFCGTFVADIAGIPIYHRTQKEEPVALCKIDGCTNTDAGKGGWCVGLCNNHISEEGSRRQRVRNQKAATSKAAADSPAKPTAAPAAPATSLVQLAQAVEDAKAALEQALAELRKAVA